jgi:hypothetical protein
MHDKIALMNSLNLSNRELNILLDELERERDESADCLREHERFQFRIIHATLTIFNNLSSTTDIQVATSNISQGGIAVLHTAYMYPKTRCLVNISLADGRKFKLKGQTVRCSHLIGRVHEIGIMFDSKLDTCSS